MYLRLSSFNGITPDQIGRESLLRNIIKQTAPCWTRIIYRFPPLAKQIWQVWRSYQPLEDQEEFPVNLPKDWQKMPILAEKIMKACPFCSHYQDDLDDPDSRIGNLEHLHLYCPCKHLVDARTYSHQQIETALRDLYNYASIRERNLTFEENHRTSTLQEDLQRKALEVEKQERPILKNAKVILDTGPINKAILLKSALDYAILLHQVPAEKLIESKTYPLSFNLGFIHSLPEDDFDISSATITDVGYSGLFPKPLLQIMNRYAREIETSKQDASEFKILIDNLVTAFIYRPIIVQTVIQILVCRMKDGIATEVKKIADQSNESSNAQSNCPASKNKDSNMTPTTAPLIQRACYAYKCRILQAKGILYTTKHVLCG
jgi:hypothetical protein